MLARQIDLIVYGSVKRIACTYKEFRCHQVPSEVAAPRPLPIVLDGNKLLQTEFRSCRSLLLHNGLSFIVELHVLGAVPRYLNHERDLTLLRVFIH